MVSDWVKPIYKWSQIAFKKKRFSAENRFFFNAIRDHLRISLTQSETIL